MPWIRNKRTGETIFVEDNAPPVDPDYQRKVQTLPTEVARSGADLQGQQIQNQRGAATLPYDVQKAAADARNAQLSPGQQALDSAFAKEYADWVNAGGSATVNKNLNNLREQARILATRDDVSGGLEDYLPPSIRRFFDEDSVNVQENVEGAIQGTLRPTLGSAFTAEEGKRVIERAYNPKANEQENLRRLNREISSLSDMAWAKGDSARYFSREGTLAGHTPAPRPRNMGEAYSYAKQHLEALIKSRGFNAEQAARARRIWEASPEVQRLKGDGGGWKIERVD